MLPIQRWRGQAPGRNRAVAYQGLVWTVATYDDQSADIQEQTRRCLALLDQNLAEAGTDKTRLVSAQVFLADMTTKPQFDVVWNGWIGPSPDTWPQRACVGATLAGHCLVEIIIVAATAT
jgi:enamine deaminase RidA (YjgF/YER057c/UK114 family)